MFKCNSKKYNLELAPKDTFAVSVFHLHNGNDPDGTKRFGFCKRGSKPAKMVTVCVIKSRETEEIVAQGFAVCSNRDNPSRRAGMGIAIGRATKALQSSLNELGDDFSPQPRPQARLAIVGGSDYQDPEEKTGL